MQAVFLYRNGDVERKEISKAMSHMTLVIFPPYSPVTSEHREHIRRGPIHKRFRREAHDDTRAYYKEE